MSRNRRVEPTEVHRVQSCHFTSHGLHNEGRHGVSHMADGLLAGMSLPRVTPQSDLRERSHTHIRPGNAVRKTETCAARRREALHDWPLPGLLSRAPMSLSWCGRCQDRKSSPWGNGGEHWDVLPNWLRRVCRCPRCLLLRTLLLRLHSDSCNKTTFESRCRSNWSDNATRSRPVSSGLIDIQGLLCPSRSCCLHLASCTSSFRFLG